MKTNLDLAQLLVRRAESDLADARRTLSSEGPYDTGLFHCQQVVEKYLKALLAVHNISYPKIHDVAELAELGQELCPTLQTLPFDISEFNPFAVMIRYDDWDADVSQALLQQVFDQCNRVRALIIEVLPKAIRPPS